MAAARGAVERTLRPRMERVKVYSYISPRVRPQIALDIIGDLGRFLIPIYDLIEKRFAPGGRIADMFLDFWN